jgi:isoquinoline 1-oxidoreductase beta subunit
LVRFGGRHARAGPTGGRRAGVTVSGRGIERRAFLRAGVAAAAGLALPFCGFPGGRAGLLTADPFTPGGWLFVASDGTVTVTLGVSEMGQRVHTALPMIVAEELDVEWSAVRVVQGGADPGLANPIMGRQRTAWSASVRGWWTPLRETSARARDLLVRAAAAQWEVAPAECVTMAGAVQHAASGRSARYGDLAPRAAELEPARRVSLKSPDSFRLLGGSPAAHSIGGLVSGSAVYGIDARPAGALTAVVERAPAFGGRLLDYDATSSLKVPGVRRVEAISSGVAVVADSTWPALQGRRRLVVKWQRPTKPADESSLTAMLDAALQSGGTRIEAAGRPGDVLAGAGTRLTATYRTPYLAHAPMEPMNCVADVRNGTCTVIVPTQDQTGVVETVQRLTGLPADAVTVHTTLLGGGFGRRVQQDFVAEAVELSRKIGAPVQVMWSREDDLRHDFYHPATAQLLEGALDAGGKLVAWRHIVAGGSGAEGAGLPYRVPHREVRHARVASGVPTGIWRSVEHFHCVFAAESFLDELAQAGSSDPVAFRHTLLGGERRLARVLEVAAERSGWAQPLPAGSGRGAAIHRAHGSYIALVAEVRIERTGPVRVRRLVCAVDPGTVIHEGDLRAQIEGALVFGLGAALSERITIRNGGVREGNFDQYRVLGIRDVPEMQVHLVPSGDPPGGVGELGVPPVAPAVCNAVYAAGGGRVRALPLTAEASSQ